jgi:hypothetical protein
MTRTLIASADSIPILAQVYVLFLDIFPLHRRAEQAHIRIYNPYASTFIINTMNLWVVQLCFLVLFIVSICSRYWIILKYIYDKNKITICNV